MGKSPFGDQMGASFGANPMTPQFFGTEFEKIKSSNSLSKVVENLELVNKWGVTKEDAIRILKGIVNTQNIRGTDLISIRVRHTNKEDARDVTADARPPRTSSCGPAITWQSPPRIRSRRF